MNALQGMNRYRKEVIPVSTWKHDIKVQYLYDNTTHPEFKTKQKTGEKRERSGMWHAWAFQNVGITFKFVFLLIKLLLLVILCL